jgi:hypothetical protein
MRLNAKFAHRNGLLLQNLARSIGSFPMQSKLTKRPMLLMTVSNVVLSSQS